MRYLLLMAIMFLSCWAHERDMFKHQIERDGIVKPFFFPRMVCVEEKK